MPAEPPPGSWSPCELRTGRRIRDAVASITAASRTGGASHLTARAARLVAVGLINASHQILRGLSHERRRNRARLPQIKPIPPQIHSDTNATSLQIGFLKRPEVKEDLVAFKRHGRDDLCLLVRRANLRHKRCVVACESVAFYIDPDRALATGGARHQAAGMRNAEVHRVRGRRDDIRLPGRSAREPPGPGLDPGFGLAQRPAQQRMGRRVIQPVAGEDEPLERGPLFSIKNINVLGNLALGTSKRSDTADV